MQAHTSQTVNAVWSISFQWRLKIHASAYESDCEQLLEKLSLEYLRRFRDDLNETNDSGSFYMDYQVKDLSIKRWGRVSVYAVDNDEVNSAEHVMIIF